jgi:hypothetical protein
LDTLCEPVLGHHLGRRKEDGPLSRALPMPRRTLPTPRLNVPRRRCP